MAADVPNTGLEGGRKHSYGPDGESSRRDFGGSMVDAYGNPIVPEEDDISPRKRLRGGAYGGSKAKQERPLPDLPETDAGWKFK